MDILKFIFVLGINFSIFGFLWGIIMLAIRALSSGGQQRNQAFEYVLRIVKYFLLVSVTANYITNYQDADIGANTGYGHIILGVIVLGLYLLGKLQNRAMMGQLANHPMLGRFMTKVDPKVELFLLIGSLIYFVVCLFNPFLVDNSLVNWFTATIIDIYDTPVIGWVFSVIAFFFLISILIRAANVIGRLVSGESILSNPSSGASFTFKTGRNPFENNPFEQRQKEEGFSDYEDVTEESDEEDKP